jgi:hypothetical protein
VLNNPVVLKQLASHPVVDTVYRDKWTAFVQAVSDDRFWTRVRHAERVLKLTPQLISALTGAL